MAGERSSPLQFVFSKKTYRIARNGNISQTKVYIALPGMANTCHSWQHIAARQRAISPYKRDVEDAVPYNGTDYKHSHCEEPQATWQSVTPTWRAEVVAPYDEAMKTTALQTERSRPFPTVVRK